MLSQKYFCISLCVQKQHAYVAQVSKDKKEEKEEEERPHETASKITGYRFVWTRTNVSLTWTATHH